jgi:hypothetical protein
MNVRDARHLRPEAQEALRYLVMTAIALIMESLCSGNSILIPPKIHDLDPIRHDLTCLPFC